MIIKTTRDICLDNVREKDQDDRMEWYENGGDDLDLKWIPLEEHEKRIEEIRKVIYNTENRPIEFAESLNKIKEIVNAEASLNKQKKLP